MCTYMLAVRLPQHLQGNLQDNMLIWLQDGEAKTGGELMAAKHVWQSVLTECSTASERPQLTCVYSGRDVDIHRRHPRPPGIAQLYPP
jgi:hypothetical protein